MSIIEYNECNRMYIKKEESEEEGKKYFFFPINVKKLFSSLIKKNYIIQMPNVFIFACV